MILDVETNQKWFQFLQIRQSSFWQSQVRDNIHKPCCPFQTSSQRYLKKLFKNLNRSSNIDICMAFWPITSSFSVRNVDIFGETPPFQINMVYERPLMHFKLFNFEIVLNSYASRLKLRTAISIISTLMLSITYRNCQTLNIGNFMIVSMTFRCMYVLCIYINQIRRC